MPDADADVRDVLIATRHPDYILAASIASGT